MAQIEGAIGWRCPWWWQGHSTWLEFGWWQPIWGHPECLRYRKIQPAGRWRQRL